MKIIVTLIACLLVNVGLAQTLSLEEYLGIVKKYHPVARQAAIGVDIARAGVTSARGAFDPVFQNDIARKELGGLLYYDHQITEVKIPTWYGIDVVTGIESLTGNKTSTPDTKGNSSYVGFSVPVGKNLLMDQRRAALQQAKIFQQLSVQEQQSLLNDLLYDAAKAYWDWYEQDQLRRLIQRAAANAEQRLKLVKTSVTLGDRPAIDTVEALAQLQSFQTALTEVQNNVTNAQLEVGVFLWRPNGEVYALPPAIIPQQTSATLSDLQPDQLLQQVEQHPALQQYNFKLASLDIDKRLKFQSLLPSVYLKYNQLTTSHQVAKNFTSPWLQNNYRYGVAISVPLRFSEGRGDYRQAKLKIEQTKMEQLNKQLQLRTKLQQQYNEWRAVQQQIRLQQSAVSSYAQLQRGEETKFFNGESSLFFINARELKTLEAQQKLVSLQSKQQKAAAATLWAAGVLVSAQR